jgi:hypothetical protein
MGRPPTSARLVGVGTRAVEQVDVGVEDALGEPVGEPAIWDPAVAVFVHVPVSRAT